MKSTKSKERIKANGEVFTPPELVNKMLNELPDSSWLEGETFCDPACGNGNFLIEIAKRKKALNHINPLATIFGVELMPDNTRECRQRLLEICGDTEENRRIVRTNIVCANALTYDFSFEVEQDLSNVSNPPEKGATNDVKRNIDNLIRRMREVEASKITKIGS